MTTRDDKTPCLFGVMGRFTGGIDFVEPAALDARSRIVAFFALHLRAAAEPPRQGPIRAPTHVSWPPEPPRCASEMTSAECCSQPQEQPEGKATARIRLASRQLNDQAAAIASLGGDVEDPVRSRPGAPVSGPKRSGWRSRTMARR